MAGVNAFPTAREAAVSCARRLLELANEAIASRGLANIAISGGSSPKPMFEWMAGQRFDWDRVHVFWVDERAVPPSDPQSNFKMAFETLCEPARVPAANLHRVLAELPPEEAAGRYVLDVQEHFRLQPGATPSFDVIHHGMGPDGHTASLFPGEPLIADRAGIAAAVYVGKLAQWRITLLPAVLLNAAHTLFLAAGADKKPALDTALQGAFDPLACPAQLVARHARDVEWFVDDAATSGTQRP